MEDQEQASETVKFHTLLCVSCENELQKPVQLSGCYHIVCSPCLSTLKVGENPHSLVCPKCDSENMNPKVLFQISGLILESPETEPKKCNVCKEKPPQWACFDCSDNLCSACMTHHQRGHKNVYRLSGQPFPILRASSPTENPGDQADSGIVFTCPLCVSIPCRHTALIERLTSPVKKEVGYCAIPTHVINDQSDKPEPLRFFCTHHWLPACGACSKLGKHKHLPCRTPDIIDMVPHINEGIEKIHNYSRMLLYLCEEELNERERVEDKLRRHVIDVEQEIIHRRQRILYHLTKAMDEVLSEAKTKGKGVLDRYKGEVRPFMEIRAFLEILQSYLRDLKVDKDEVDIPKYVNSFELLKETNESLEELEKFLKRNGVFKDERFEEMRLVLPSVPDSFSAPPLLSKVGCERRHLKLICDKEIDIAYSVDSFIVTGLAECIYTEKRENDKYGRMVKLTIKEKKDDTNNICHEFTSKLVDIPQGRYQMALMKSGEIVASFEYDEGGKQEFDLVYFPSMPSTGSERFSPIYHEADMPLGGTAVTADSNVLVCVDLNAEGKKVGAKKAASSYLMVISLQGRVIKGSQHNLHSPKHIAVSDHGEIAISDSGGHCVVIMDSNFKLIDRVQYYLPTSMSNYAFSSSDDRFFFHPEGICYDSYGRILVTDSVNNSIVRLSRNAEDKFTMEPLIVYRQDLEDFVGPYLVAIGPGQRLWVVCKRKMFIFDYQSF